MDISDQLYEALMSAFTPAEMKMLLHNRLEQLDIDAIATGNKSEQFHDVVLYAERHSRLGDLIVAAFMERSANEKVEAVFRRYTGELSKRRGGGRIMTEQPYNIDRSQSFEDRLRAVEDVAKENRVRLRGWDGSNGLESEVRELKKQLTELNRKMDDALDALGHIDAARGVTGAAAMLIRWVVVGASVLYAALSAAGDMGWWGG